MMRLRIVLVTAAFVMAGLGTNGCLPKSKKADLVPHTESSISGSLGYCQLDQGQLVIMVRNQGDRTAPASTTSVEFNPGGQVLISTPPIAEGAEATLSPITVPGVSYNPDSDFTITVDFYDNVNESNEANNVAQGMCLG